MSKITRVKERLLGGEFKPLPKEQVYFHPEWERLDIFLSEGYMVYTKINYKTKVLTVNTWKPEDDGYVHIGEL